jgi:hypothetical protein
VWISVETQEHGVGHPPSKNIGKEAVEYLKHITGIAAF